MPWPRLKKSVKNGVKGISMKHLVLMVLATSFLAGCTTTQSTNNGQANYLRGTKKCSGELIQQAFTNASNMAQVSIGMEKQAAFAVMGVPQKYESFALKDDRVLEAMFYRTGSEDCYGASDAEPFTPLVFKDGILIGFGADYYRVMIKPALRKAPPAPKAKPAPVHQQAPVYQYQYPYGYPQGYVPVPVY